jgi:hypothetical protein
MLKKLENWYVQNETRLSTLGLVFGFIFDAITLKRVDLFWENVWVIVHLAGAAIGIIFLNLYEKGRVKEEVPGRMHFYLLLLIQFMFGGLLSTFLVFYFRSATLATSWPFLLLLAIVFMANERLKKHYTRLSFQISVLFISTYSFAIYIVPVFFHRVGADIFIISGALSVIALAVFLFFLWFITREEFKKSRNILMWSIGSIVVLINFFYFTNLIPPLPLSVKEAGVYRSVYRNPEGKYITESDSVTRGLLQRVKSFFTLYERYNQTPGDPVYLYSAVFSPTRFNTSIVHHWQRYSDVQKRWMTMARIPLPIAGGRDGGYRTYSYKTNLQEGKWRVDVETLNGQDIGRVRFIIENK